MLYDKRNDKYVAILYHGSQTEASLKQYTFRVTKTPDAERKRGSGYFNLKK